jgi:hypothetical protein
MVTAINFAVIESAVAALPTLPPSKSTTSSQLYSPVNLFAITITPNEHVSSQRQGTILEDPIFSAAYDGKHMQHHRKRFSV